jgi:hypothetical protein
VIWRRDGALTYNLMWFSESNVMSAE